MVRSFSRVEPCPQPKSRGRDMYVFQKWIATVAPLLFEDKIEDEQWRTARPWLDFNGVRTCYHKYLKHSLGSLKCGKFIVTDALVGKAVGIERSITRTFDRGDPELLQELVELLFEPCAERQTSRAELMEHVNKELLARRKSIISLQSQAWRTTLHSMGMADGQTHYNKVRLMLRKDCTDEFVAVIQMYYEPDDKELDVEVVKGTVGRYLAHQSRRMDDHVLAVQRAIRKTSLFLKLRTDNVVAVIRKHYAPVLEHTADRNSIIDVVNELLLPRPYDHPVWDVAFAEIDGAEHLAPIVGVDYDAILARDYEYDADATLTFCQIRKRVIQIVGEHYRAPFLKAAVRRLAKHRHELVPLRRKKNIPWDNILHLYCKRGRCKHTVGFLNHVLRYMGFAPYHRDHKVWEYVHAKGVCPKTNVLMMLRKCCTVTQRTTPRAEVLAHVNVLHDLALTEDMPEWTYAMTHFRDGPLPLTPK